MKVIEFRSAFSDNYLSVNVNVLVYLSVNL